MNKKLKSNHGSTLITSIVMIIVLSIIASTVIIILSSTTNATVKRIARREEKIALTTIMYEVLEKYNGVNTIENIVNFNGHCSLHQEENTNNTIITVSADGVNLNLKANVAFTKVTHNGVESYTYTINSWEFSV